MRRGSPLVAVLALAVALAIVPPASAQPPQGGPAVQNLQTCLESSKRLSVVVLVDESGSLGQTDPDDERVGGLRSVLTGLARLADGGQQGTGPQVEVLLVGFSSGVTPAPGDDDPPWRPLTQETVGGLLDRAGEFAARDSGRDTDYGTALLAARQFLADRTAERTRRGDPAPCKALVWFTDGRYDILDRTDDRSSGLPRSVPYAPGVPLDRPGGGARAVDTGRAYLCRAGGLRDRLAQDGVVIFTVGLAAQLAAADEAYLRAVTTGRGAGCGTRANPRNGRYLGVRDSGSLFFVFGGLFEGPARIGRPVRTCVVTACPAGRATFRTVPGIGRFFLQATTGADGVVIELRSPRGRVVRLRPDAPRTVESAGVRLQQRWFSDTQVEVTADIRGAGPGAVGVWGFTFVGPPGAASARPRYAVRLTPDVVPALGAPTEIVKGRATDVPVALRDGRGRPAAPGLVARGTYRVALTDPSRGRPLPRASLRGPTPDGRLDVVVDVATASPVPRVAVEVEATFPDIAGFPVEPVGATFLLRAILPPGAGYPVVSPDALQLPSVTGAGTTRGTLTVTGSPEAPGCVWVTGAAVDGPDEQVRPTAALTPAVVDQNGCLALGAGEARTVEVAFTTEEGRGRASGAVTVALRSGLAPAEVREVEIPVTFDLTREPDVTTQVLVLVVLTVCGIVLPIALLHVLNVLGARFSPPQRLRYRADDVAFSPGGLVTLRDGDEVPVDYRSFALVSDIGEARGVATMDIDRLAFRTVASGSPRDGVFSLFTGPYGVVSANDQPLLAGAGQPLRAWRDGRLHEVPLALAGTWFFIPSGAVRGEAAFGDEAAAPVESVLGRLILVIADGGSVDDGSRLLVAAQVALGNRDWDGLPAAPGDQAVVRGPGTGTHEAPSDDDGFRF